MTTFLTVDTIMNYAFNPALFKALFQTTIDDYRDHFQFDENSENSPDKLIIAMNQAVDVMERADSDKSVKAGNQSPLEASEVSEIGNYALTILDMCLTHIETATGKQARDLMRLSIPIAVWVARQGGRVESIEMVVNSVAGFANDIQDSAQLSELCKVIGEIIEAVSDPIRQDLDNSNPMRPWRIININYCIIATRSHDTALMEQSYDALIKNLPQDARQFFKEGKQQMDIIGYPDEVRSVVEKYDLLWGSGSTLH